MIVNAFGSHENADPFFENRKVGSEWLTSIEAAQALGISPNALRILVCRGKIKYSKFGHRLRFCANDLAALLRKGA